MIISEDKIKWTPFVTFDDDKVFYKIFIFNRYLTQLLNEVKHRERYLRRKRGNRKRNKKKIS